METKVFRRLRYFVSPNSCIQTNLEGMVIIDVEVKPNSSRQGIVGFNEWNGKLQVAVKAKAEKGKANFAVTNVLSKVFETDARIVSGKTSRHKKIILQSKTPNEVTKVLEGLFES